MPNWVRNWVRDKKEALTTASDKGFFVRRIGLEPTTSTVSGWRSKPTELTPQNSDALLHRWPKDSTQQLRAHERKLFFYPSPRAMATF